MNQIAHTHNPIVLFDGICNLCNSVVQYVLRNDKRQLIRFASLQSDFGRKILIENSMSADKLETFIYLKPNGRLLTKSDAFFALMRDLGGIHRLFEVGRIVPKVPRNALYSVIAKNRYRIFGRRAHCYMPTPEWQNRFID